MSSTCCAMCGYQSETHMPLWPYCFHLRVRRHQRVVRRPIAVISLPNDAGIGCPASFVELRLRIEQIDVARTAFHEQPDHRFGRRRMVRLAGRQRVLDGLSAPRALRRRAGSPARFRQSAAGARKTRGGCVSASGDSAASSMSQSMYRNSLEFSSTWQSPQPPPLHRLPADSLTPVQELPGTLEFRAFGARP